MFTFSNARKHLTCLGVAACAGLAAAATGAYAQSYYDDSDSVTVYAPYHMMPDRDDMTGAPIRTVSASRVVYLDDLNLGARWGQRAMRQRIRNAAYQLCDQLDQTNLTTQDITTSECVNRATSDALYRVNERINVSY